MRKMFPSWTLLLALVLAVTLQRGSCSSVSSVAASAGASASAQASAAASQNSVKASATAHVAATTSANAQVTPSPSAVVQVASSSGACGYGKQAICYTTVQCTGSTVKMAATSHVVAQSSAAVASSAVASSQVKASATAKAAAAQSLVCNNVVKCDCDVVVVSVEPTKASSVVAVPSSSAIPCVNDCNGDCNGDAYVGPCGICVEGKTGKFRNYTMDCNEQCNGTAITDKTCNACVSPGTNVTDCNGDCFGDAIVDSCGDCVLGETNKTEDYRKDGCGVCGGNNSTCAGCDNIPNSGKVEDACGVCGGDGSTCTDISSLSPSSMPDTGGNVTVNGAGLDGSAVKCIINGTESAGYVVSKVKAMCPVSGIAGGNNVTLQVKVTKNGAEITVNSTLHLYVFATAGMVITEVSPVKAYFADSPSKFELKGTNLKVLEGAYCDVGGTKTKATYKSSTAIECEVTSQFHEFSSKNLVNFYINGVYKVNASAVLNYTLYAKAPQMSSIKFSSNGAFLEVTFDALVEVPESWSQPCREVFVGITSDTPCEWVDYELMFVMMDENATIIPGVTLAPKANAIKALGEQYSDYATNNTTILAPDDPDLPTAILEGPETLSSCSNLTLSGSQSFGGGGRDLKYRWSLVSPNDNALNSTLTGLADTKSSVEIDKASLTAGVEYKFKLEVKNYLASTWSSDELSVTKSSDPVPEIYLDIPLDTSQPTLETLTSDSFSIFADVLVSTCGNGTKVLFEWTVTSTDASATSALQSNDAFKSTKNTAELYIEEGVLQGDVKYTFTVKASMSHNTSIASTSSVPQITAKAPALEPGIFGGERVIGRSSGKFQLDAASATFDPAEASGSLSCSWVCQEVKSKSPCYSATTKGKKLTFANNCTIDLDALEFKALDYKFTVYVTKGSRSANTYTELTIAEGDPPSVILAETKLSVSASEALELSGWINAATLVSVNLTGIPKLQGYNYVDLSDSNNTYGGLQTDTFVPNTENLVYLTIKENVLRAGSKYKFKLSVFDGSATGSATIEVTVRRGPTSGSIAVNPSTVVALNDVKITAPKWVTDKDAYPLEYEFGYVDEDGFNSPLIFTTKNEYTCLAPEPLTGNTIDIYVVVTDSYGSYAERKTTITVSEPQLDDAALDSLLSGSVDDVVNSGNWRKASANIQNIVSAAANSANLTTAQKGKAATKALDVVTSISNGSALNADASEQLLGTLSKIPATYLASDTGDSIFDTAASLLTGMGEKPLKLNKANDLLKLTQGLSADSEKMKSADAALAKSLSAGVKLGGPAAETDPNNPRVVVKAQHVAFGEALSASKVADATSLNFGSDMKSKFTQFQCPGGKKAGGGIIRVKNYKNGGPYAGKTNSLAGTINNAKMMDVTVGSPCKKSTTVTIKNLAKPVSLTIKGATTAGKTPTCAYYDETKKAFVSDGMTTKTQANGDLVCETTHFTAFSVSSADTPTPAPTPAPVPTTEETGLGTGELVGIIVGALAFIIIIIIIVIVMKKKKSKNVKISQMPLTERDENANREEDEAV